MLNNEAILTPSWKTSQEKSKITSLGPQNLLHVRRFRNTNSSPIPPSRKDIQYEDFMDTAANMSERASRLLEGVCDQCREIFTTNQGVRSLFAEEGRLRPWTEVLDSRAAGCSFCTWMHTRFVGGDGKTAEKGEESRSIRMSATAFAIDTRVDQDYLNTRVRQDYWTSDKIGELKFTFHLLRLPSSQPVQTLVYGAHALEGISSRQ